MLCLNRMESATYCADKKGVYHTMPLKGMLLIFIIILTACWCFRGDIYAFIKGGENKEEQEEKDTESKEEK